ncbi:MAG: ATP-binding cassette domain-containing protein, partial [Flavisolibacter sp.]
MISALRATSEAFFTSRPYVGWLSKKKPGFLRTTFSVLEAGERRHFSFLIASDIFISVVDILSLALLLWIVQFYLQPGAIHTIKFLSEDLASKNSVVLIAMFFVLFTIKNFCAFYISRLQFQFIGRVAVRISKNNLESYQQSTFEEFVNVDSSVHLRKIAYQPFDFCQYMLSGVQQVVTQSSLIGIAIAGILLFNAKLFLLLLLILLPPVVLVFYYIKKRLTKAKWHIKKGNEKSFQYLMDALKGYVDGNIYGRNHFFSQRFVEQRKNFSHHLFDSMSIQTLPSRLIEVFAVMGLFILIVIARWSGSGDSHSLITIGAFMVAAYKIIPGLVKIINATSQIKAYEFSLNELVAGTKESSAEAQHVRVIESITLENIRFGYGGQHVLADLSICAKKGDFVGISGRSGTGKTSLLNLCLGFLEPNSGTISINGVVVSQQELKSYWPRIAYVRQQAFLIHDSIARNISLEENCEDKEKLSRVLDIV